MAALATVRCKYLDARSGRDEIVSVQVPVDLDLKGQAAEDELERVANDAVEIALWWKGEAERLALLRPILIRRSAPATPAEELEDMFGDS